MEAPVEVLQAFSEVGRPREATEAFIEVNGAFTASTYSHARFHHFHLLPLFPCSFVEARGGRSSSGTFHGSIWVRWKRTKANTKMHGTFRGLRCWTLPRKEVAGPSTASMYFHESFHIPRCKLLGTTKSPKRILLLPTLPLLPCASLDGRTWKQHKLSIEAMVGGSRLGCRIPESQAHSRECLPRVGIRKLCALFGFFTVCADAHGTG